MNERYEFLWESRHTAYQYTAFGLRILQSRKNSNPVIQSHYVIMEKKFNCWPLKLQMNKIALKLEMSKHSILY